MKIKLYDTKLHAILLVADLIGAALGIMLATLIRFRVLLGINTAYDQIWVLWLILIIVTFVNVAKTPVVKFTRRRLFAELTDVISRQMIVLASLLIILYLAHSTAVLSRLVFVYFAVAGVVIIWLLRLLLKWYLLNIRRKGAAGIKVFVIADEKRLDEVVERFNRNKDWDRYICSTAAGDKTAYKKILKYLVHNQVDEVFISMASIEDKEAFRNFAMEIVGMGIRLDIDLEQFELNIPGQKWLDEVGHCAVISSARNNISISRRFLKRSLDIVGALVGMAGLAVVSIFLVPIIKIDSKGPAIFRQKRVGKNGRIFDFYKFRSMCADAEAQKKKLMAQNEVAGLMFKIKDDPRITKVGRFIRKTSLDELPQFWNVLKGDMSLVGTRPPTLDEYEKYEPWQKARLSMRPGITGLWQVSGRSDIKDFDEVVRLDMEYIDNWSLVSDVKILLKTILVVFAKKGSR